MNNCLQLGLFVKKRRLFYVCKKNCVGGRSNCSSFSDGVIIYTSFYGMVFSFVWCDCFSSMRRGLYPALFSGLVWGVLHFPLGKVVYLSFSQVLLEYIVAFGVMGFAGLLYHQFQKAIRNDKQALAIFYIFISSFIGVGIRYFWHFVAGFLFWGKYAPEGVSPYWYSFTVNGIAGLQTLIVTIVVAILLLKYPKIYKTR